MKLWVVVPVYDDVPSFLRLRDELKSLDLARHYALHFLFIDDTAGVDSRVPVEIEGLSDVEVIRPVRNLGHQKALVYGLRLFQSRFDDDDVVVTMDSDGQDRPEDVPQMIEALRAHSSLEAVALAIRTSRKESLAFRICYFFFKLAFRLLAGTVVRNGNFIAYRGAFARRHLGRAEFDLAYASTFEAMNFEKIRVPLPRGERWFGQSKMGWRGLVLHGLTMFQPFQRQIRRRGLVIMIVLLIACGLGLAYFARQIE